MATRAIRPKRDDTMLAGWQSMPEQAPSDIRAEQPTVARVLAMVGVLLCAVGLLAMVAPVWNWGYIVSAGWGFFFLSLGVNLVLFHAFADRDLQFRRIYMVLGLGLIGVAGVLRVLPYGGGLGAYFVPVGIPFLGLGLLFLIAVIRHETEPGLQVFLIRVIGVLGAVMALVGLFVGQFSADFLGVEGLLLLVLALLYLSGFIAMADSPQTGYRAGLALGIIAAVSLGITLLRILWPVLFNTEAGAGFMVPSGMILMCMSLVYLGVSLAICSDWPLVVLVRRELAGFFYSPIAYLVILALVLVSWVNFFLFLNGLIRGALDPRQLAFEPIVRGYIVSLIPVIAQMFVVPILTMRLLSEERRSGTLEMVLTAPVNEATIVVSKLLAAWFFYLMTWAPALLFLVAVRALGGNEFDYRPVLAFLFAIGATGLGFVAMGLFFSSITRNQIIAAVFTFLGMTLHLSTFILSDILQRTGATLWSGVFHYVSFVDLWYSTLEGILAPRFLVFHVSAAIFFVFLTIKVLEARKWS